MNVSLLLKSLPTTAPGRAIGLMLVAAALMGLAATMVLETPLSAGDGFAEDTSPPQRPTETGKSSLFIDHSVVDWSQISPAPNPSPLAVAAYGD